MVLIPSRGEWKKEWQWGCFCLDFHEECQNRSLRSHFWFNFPRSPLPWWVPGEDCSGGDGKLHFLQECWRSEDAACRRGKINVCVVSGQRGNLLICRYSTYRHLNASGHSGGRRHTDVTAKLKQHSAECMQCSRDRELKKRRIASLCGEVASQLNG